MVDTAAYVSVFILYGGIAFLGGLFVFLVGIGFYFVWRMMRYKTQINIYEKVGGYFRGESRLAREVVNKMVGGKRHSYILLRKPYKGKNKLDLIPSENYVPFGGGFFNKKQLNLHFSDGLFTPLPIKENSPAALTFNTQDLLRVLDSWDKDYAENYETHRPKEGFWDKYHQYITIISVLGLTLVFWVLIYSLMNSGGGGGGLPQIIN